MKPLENVWSGLLQRRLLPVAILLLAALVAVPLVLSKDPDPIPAAPAAPAADKSQTASAATAEPVVSLVADGERTQRRRVLGVRKNPFEPAKAPKVEATPTPDAGPAVAQTQTTGGTDTGPTGGTPVTIDGGSPPVFTPGVPGAPAPTETAKKPKYELYSLTVRFGASDGESLARMNLPRLKALPSVADPLLVYLGPGKGGKSAVFMVDASLEPQGDGSCDPSPVSCQTIELGVGETEFFDVLDETGKSTAQYQLDLLAIKRSTTADAAKAKTARAKASKAGRRVLRARQASRGPLRYRYDVKSGTVRSLEKRAYKSLMAKTARIALGVAGGF